VLKKVLPALGLFGVLSVGFSTELVCVNGDELLKESTYLSKLDKNFKEKGKHFQELQKKIQEIVQKLKKLQKELQSGLLSDEAKKQKQQEFIKLQQQLQQLQIEIQYEYSKLSKEFQKFNQLVTKSVKASLKTLAKTEGFKAAVDCKNLLYYDKSIDITAKVAKVLDQFASQTKGVQNNSLNILKTK
jgi:Skp family chaperone for outer membrane proteins